MSQPPFTMSKYASELELLRDKCAWQEQALAAYLHAVLVAAPLLVRIRDRKDPVQFFEASAAVGMLEGAIAKARGDTVHGVGG
jgi:hypothetical protein